ncbi:MAG: amino acid permease [Spirochaetes bacterium]|nr:MAG: amino acid permease [Spirochaetota bacterium]
MTGGKPVSPGGRPNTLFSEDTELKRELGLTETVSIVIGRIIGSGIFRTPGIIMACTLSTGLFGLVWLVGGIITIFGAMSYAELVAMIPKSGGPYVFLREAYNPIWAFLRGWAMFFVAETGSIAAVALVFAEHTGALIRISTGEGLSGTGILAVACATIWVLTLVNCFGVFLSGVVQDVFSFVKVLALGAVIGTCFTAPGDFAHFSAPLWPEQFTWGTLLAFGTAMRYSFFAYSGWEGATYVAEEVKNPRRNLPISLFVGISGVFILYIGANSAYLYQLPVEQFKESSWIAVDAIQMAAGALGGALISGAVMLNTFGNVGTQILCKARTWQAMASDGLFFKKLSEIHPRYKTPNYSLIFQGAWATVLLAFAAAEKNSYEAIIDFFTVTGTVFNIMTFASVFILRKKYPDAPRPYKAWLYPYSVVAVIVFHLAYLAITLITAFVPSMLGLLLTSSGLLYYYREKIFRRAAKTGAGNG